MESVFNWIKLSSGLGEVEDDDDKEEGNDDDGWWWTFLEDPFKTGAEDKIRTSLGPANKKVREEKSKKKVKTINLLLNFVFINCYKLNCSFIGNWW